MNRRSFIKGLALGVIGIKLLLEAPRSEGWRNGDRFATRWSEEIEAVSYENVTFTSIPLGTVRGFIT